MINKLLIANRGEIAVRIIATCRRLGIATVAVFSTADRNAKYVAMADEAYCIGEPEASLSYLDKDKIIQVALRCGAEGIHPGYGFLSENADFAELCQQNDIAFVGPRSDVVRRMGSKIESKKIAAQCDVPTVPGYFGDNQDPKMLAKEAQKIGMPLLIKASAGGGGRGMRVVEHIDEFATQLALATSEAESAFGDSKVLLERYIQEPRHLEVQVLGDNHGNVIHLFERECSIQRNHQKVIEEAPAAFLNDGAKEQLFANALKLAEHISYNSAGTVEFIVDNESQEVFFLEMNTRLQVEHPVTECITGVDLVEWQIRIASNETLGVRQADLSVTGWAIEARVTAEDPANNYLPQVGILSVYQEPSGDGVRIDSGIEPGSHISPYYDSMISKTIAFGADRQEARVRLINALNNYSIGGVGNNLAFLRDLLRHPNFVAGPLTTHYIARTFEQGWQASNPGASNLVVLAALVRLYKRSHIGSSPWHALPNWRLLARAGQMAAQHISLLDAAGERVDLKFEADNQDYSVQVVSVSDDTVEPVKVHVDHVDVDETSVTAQIDQQLFRFNYHIDDRSILLSKHSASYHYLVLEKRHALATDETTELSREAMVRAPMPGIVNAVHVAPGESVEAGQVLVAMEAMKLLQNLTAGVSGVVAQVHCAAGQNVAANELLIEISAAES